MCCNVGTFVGLEYVGVPKEHLIQKNINRKNMLEHCCKNKRKLERLMYEILTPLASA